MNDASAKRKNPCTGKAGARAFALNGANCAKEGIDALREHIPSLRTDPRTEEIENCVFTNVGGGFASGGSVGAGVGAFGGPVGAAIGAALGAAVGSIGGAVATAVDYCCDLHGCHKRND